MSILPTQSPVPPKPRASKELKPFYCPNCGGNSYRKVNGKIVCDYCDTEFISEEKSSTPFKDVRPAPLPTMTTK